ncbi:type VI secretion system membrane subunit TssM [Sphingomonas sp. NCPPB 2930]
MMRMVQALGAVLFHRVVLQIVGLALLVCLVWFVGPLIAFAGHVPLESEASRWWVIGTIVALFLLRALVRQWRRRGVNARLMGYLVQSRSAATDAVPDAQGQSEIVELRQRFGDALGTLRKARLKPTTGPWWTRLGRQYVYELPWYMFIGAPGSGKTTALTNAGLTFPLEEKFGKTAIRGVGGTRNCDWWFTNEAVMLDTAGRYTTHESNEVLDKSEWEGFLSLLKRFRPRQPLNGVLLTLAVPDLLAMSDVERRNHAAVMRKRLYELRDQLAIQFPVYLLVTKCDLIAGFGEYFSRLDREQRAQVWGFTFPYETKTDGTAEASTAFDREFGLLSRRLYNRLNDTLLAEPDLERRALAYTFPQNFDGLQGVLAQFVADVFVQSKYGEPPVLRGVYFSSGAQEGVPFDRVLGMLTQAFRIKAPHRPASLAQGRGVSFFLSDLLLKVVFQEVGLAGRNMAWERRRGLLRAAGAIGCGIALLLAGIAWTVSYRGNARYLEHVDKNTASATQALQTFGRTPESDLEDLMELLTQVRTVSRSSDFPIEQPPLSMTYGLYQGDKIDAVAQAGYARTLEDGLLPHMARRIEAWLRNPPQPNNLELVYETLKAYLMLYDPGHFEPGFMEAFSLSVLGQEMTTPVTHEQRDVLAGHVGALFRGGRVLASPYPRDDALVQQVRNRLSQFSVAQLTYLRLKRNLSQNALGDFTVLKAAGPGAASVLRFRSGKPLSNGVPGLFTYRGWHELFKKDVDSVATRLGVDEAWVLEDAAKSSRQRADEIAQGKLITEVKRLYLNEYADTWDAFLKDLQMVTPPDLERSIQTARILSAPDSPLALLVKAAALETTLLREEKSDNQSLIGRTLQQARSSKEDLERIIGTNVLPASQQPRERLELIVDNRFAPLRSMAMAGPSGQAQIDTTVLPLINELYLQLAATDAALRAANPPPQNDVATKLRAEASRFPLPVRDMLTSLASAGANQAASMMRANLTSQIDASVGQICRTSVAGRYPIVRGAAQEITPGDFARLFAPGGLLDDFFQKNLANTVDTSTNPWTFRRSVDGAAAGGSAALPPFQKAQTVRDVFFRNGGRTPQLTLTIKPVEMDAAISQLVIDIDGQVVRYAHGPQVAQTITWPGPRGSNQVRVQATPSTAGTAGLATEGAWGLHRFFDKLQITPGNSPERFTATLRVDDHKASFEVIAASVQNPFALPALQSFTCPGR